MPLGDVAGDRRRPDLGEQDHEEHRVENPGQILDERRHPCRAAVAPLGTHPGTDRGDAEQGGLGGRQEHRQDHQPHQEGQERDTVGEVSHSSQSSRRGRPIVAGHAGTGVHSASTASHPDRGDAGSRQGVL